ncbi:MAG: phytoene desaturase family protein [Bacteroidia bacterium]
MPRKKVIVVGSGFAGLSAATNLAHRGYEVTLLEKNAQFGGRARVMESQGFRFDMGPSWYWMPDVFEAYFAQFGKKVSDYYHLHRLDPGYTVFFGKDDVMTVPAQMPEIERMFEQYEPGSAKKLRSFMVQAGEKYQIGMRDLVYKPNRSVLEYASVSLLRNMLKMDVFQSMRSHVYAHFKEPRLRKLMEFPVLFLGATPQNTPALYSLMNYADLSLGTWYPMGGMGEIVKAFVALAQEQGVELIANAEVQSIECIGAHATRIHTAQKTYDADIVVAAGDYHHIEQQVLPATHRQYSQAYWKNRTMAPSSLLFYIGLKEPLPGLTHHSLFFDEEFDRHAEQIYARPSWPDKPLFYTSLSSKTDPTVAPEGKENLVILVPLAVDLPDPEEARERCYHQVMDRFEHMVGVGIRDKVEVRHSYAHSDFRRDYHAFGGNAYGLANTLAQTAIFKPSMRHKKLANLYFTGQLTIPGPGVPPTIISGQVVTGEIVRDWPLS